MMDGSFPKKPCRTCKNRFHAGCLYKVRLSVFFGKFLNRHYLFLVVQFKSFIELSFMSF